MKLTFALVAALLMTAGCSHKQTRSDANSQASAVGTSPVQANDGGTVSGAPTSLGAVSSGRGH